MKYYCRFCGVKSHNPDWVQGICPRCGTRIPPKEW
jgi:DNA-directed RNA polymerase subunit RPC12/RpoP